jgi:FtsZ-binding cell division protein ZapB|tara:strand:+ start:422 stop:640 length:219 start_codon:yes stop_codon:yes gene_type:complete
MLFNIFNVYYELDRIKKQYNILKQEHFKIKNQNEILIKENNELKQDKTFIITAKNEIYERYKQLIIKSNILK